MTLKPHMVRQIIYWLNAWHSATSNLVASLTIHEVNYNPMHCQFGHPSKDILRRASGNTKNFPSGISYLKNNPVCKGCAEGKMPSQAFPKSDSQATKPFEKIYMDFKSMPVVSYHKYKYFIVFYDDFTSHGWTMNLKLKSEAKKAIRQFNAMVKNQHKTSIICVQIDRGGKFQSISLQELFKDLGIKVFLSAPHMHQQNGCAERFIRTIMDKAQAIWFDACIPPSWWEFTVAHAVHLYNKTSVQ
jgi:Integrase core domain